MNKQALTQKINALDALTPTEKAALVELLNTKRYGLVWEDKPEDVEEDLKTKLPILREITNKKIISPRQTLADITPKKELNVPQTSLDFGHDNEPISADVAPPVMMPAINHALIEGDNLHALTVLNYTHAQKIDVIYIDPPYNTGNKDFKYNDHFVDKEDGYRHSKWLSFMAKRLALAKNLLSDKGVIFISIDDNEQAQLKLLCDEIFGESNFVGEIIVETATDNNPRQISIEHEYLMCYCKNLQIQGKWISTSYGAKLIEDEYQRLVKIYKTETALIQRDLRKWIKDNKDSLNKVSHYSYVDELGVYYPDNPSNTKPGGYEYEVLHPKTNLPCALPTNGFRFPENTFINMIEAGNIEFGNDESIIPKPKRRLSNVKDLLRSVFYEDGRVATGELLNILGSKMFNNPKSIRLLNYFLVFIPDSKSATILDFFAGSGTTLHATMALNAEDGGNRQCILVTNNENNICEEVTYERNKRVIEGYTNAKGTWVQGLSGNNLRYYQTDYVGRAKSQQNKKALVNLATEMLCLKEGIYQEILPTKGVWDVQSIRLFQDNDRAFMIIYEEDAIENAIGIIETIESQSPIKVYIFANGAYPFTDEFEEVLDRIELCALPDAIYRAYQRFLPKDSI